MAGASAVSFAGSVAVQATEQGVQHFLFDTLHEMFVRTDGVAVRQWSGYIGPLQRGDIQECFDFCRDGWQDGLEVDRQDAECFQQTGADLMELVAFFRVFRQDPGLVFIDVGVDFVCQMHDLAKCAVVFPFFVQVCDVNGCCAQGLQQRYRCVCPALCQLPAESFGDETCGAAGDVDVFADQVGIDARDEVISGEIDIFDTFGELGGEIVAQPIRGFMPISR